MRWPQSAQCWTPIKREFFRFVRIDCMHSPAHLSAIIATKVLAPFPWPCCKPLNLAHLFGLGSSFRKTRIPMFSNRCNSPSPRTSHDSFQFSVSQLIPRRSARPSACDNSTVNFFEGFRLLVALSRKAKSLTSPVKCRNPLLLISSLPLASCQQNFAGLASSLRDGPSGCTSELS